MDFSDIASTTKNIWELFSDANEIAKKTENLDLQRKLNELQGQIIFLERQLLEKDKKLLEYEKIQEDTKNFIFENNLYWSIGDNEKTGPFCPKCKNGESKSSQMTTDTHFYRCPVCSYNERHTAAKKVSMQY